MDGAGGPLLDDELTEELTSLQRRAYGPGADIHTDPAAFARLEQLEAAGRFKPARDASIAEPPAEESVAPPAAEPPAPAASPAPAAAPLVDDAPGAPSSRVLGMLRRHSWWICLMVLALALATAIVPAAWQPRPEAVLSPAPGSGDLPTMLEDAGYLDYLGVADADDLVPYAPHLGLTPWVAPTTAGGQALVVTAGDNVIALGIGRDPIYPVADVRVDNWLIVEGGVDAEKDSLVRFTLRDGDVTVWVAPPDDTPLGALPDGFPLP